MSDHRPDLISAWRAGRLISRLDWDLQRAHLRIYGVSIGRAPIGKLIEELALVARDLVGPVAEKDDLTAAIRAPWGDFLQQIDDAVAQGALPEFDLRDANLEIVKRVCKGADFAEAHEDVCSALVNPSRELIGKIAGLIEEAIRFDELKIRMFRLGRLVGQGAHPGDVYRHMAVYPDDTDDPSEGSWWLATRETAPGDVMPEGKWFGEVKQRWAELGVSSPLPTSFTRLAAGQADVTVGDVSEEIDSVALSTLGSLNIPPPEDLEGWIISSKRKMLNALDKTETYTEYLKKLEKEGAVEIKETVTGLFAFRFKDPALHAHAEKESAKGQKAGKARLDGV